MHLQGSLWKMLKRRTHHALRLDMMALDIVAQGLHTAQDIKQ